MHDWHVTPEYINRQWTEEQFLLMFQKRNLRMRLESGWKPPAEVSADLLLEASGVKMKIV